MFLLALLFFLLGTSVFSAPPTERHTKVGKVDGGYPEHQPVLEAEKRHVGLWYPVDGKAASRISLIFSQISHPCHSDATRLFRFSLADKLDVGS